jgi:hypothetical protein
MSTSALAEAHRSPVPNIHRSSGRNIMRHGLIAGALGFAVTAVAFAVANVIAGLPVLHTAAFLGAALFRDANDPASVTIIPSVVAMYSIAHLAVFLGFGLVTAWLASIAARGPQLWYVALFAFVFVGFHIIGATQLMAAPIEAALSGPVIWVAGILASLIMAGYVISRHPELQRSESWGDSGGATDTH